jgi:hypothetical protein
MFWHSSRRGLVVVFTGCLLTGNNLVAQQPGASTESDLAALYSRGMSEFQNGDYARAASDLEALVAKAEFAPINFLSSASRSICEKRAGLESGTAERSCQKMISAALIRAKTRPPRR